MNRRTIFINRKKSSGSGSDAFDPIGFEVNALVARDLGSAEGKFTYLGNGRWRFSYYRSTNNEPMEWTGMDDVECILPSTQLHMSVLDPVERLSTQGWFHPSGSAYDYKVELVSSADIWVGISALVTASWGYMWVMRVRETGGGTPGWMPPESWSYEFT